MISKKHPHLTMLEASKDNTMIETILNMYHLPFLTWREVIESDSA